MQCHPTDIHAVTISTDGPSAVSEPKLSPILSALQLCKSMKQLIVNFWALPPTSQQLLTMGAILANNTATLEYFQLGGNQSGDDGLEILSTKLQQCTNLRALSLFQVDLTSQSGTTLGRVLSCLLRIEMLILSFNNLKDSGLEQMAEGLKQCKKLMDLRLDSLCLTSRSGSVLRDVVSSLPKLERLMLGRNKLGDTGLEQLAGGLQRCTNLTDLLLNDTRLSARSVPTLRLISALPSLESLVVSGSLNRFSQDSIIELQAAVPRRLKLHV